MPQQEIDIAAPKDCRAAIFAGISDNLRFEPSNLAFSPAFGEDAAACFADICKGDCAACTLLQNWKARTL